MQSFNRVYNIVISAVLMGVAQLNLGLGWLAWFCLIPFFIAIKNQNSFRGLCLDAFVWGFIYHLVSLFWLTDNIGVPDRLLAFITMLLANLVCSFNIVLIIAIWHLINKLNGRKIWYAFPVVWTMIDFLASLGSISFPWASIANTQAQPSLIFMMQFIELTGMFGITLWIVLINISIFHIYLKRDKVLILDSIGILALPLILSFFMNKKDIKMIEEINFAILQPNVSINDKNHIHSNKLIGDLLEKSKNYINQGKEYRLLIWPETAFNHFNKKSYPTIKKHLIDSNVALLTGVFEIDEKRIHNSIYFLKKDNNYEVNRAQKYRKIKMVPLAEHVPLSGVFPSLNNVALSGNFSKGKEYTLFDYKNSRFAAMICIESTYSSLSRKFVKEGANFLIYVANDGWYIEPPQAQQHAKQTIFRAIETRKPVIRCGNTGISWVVDSHGKVLKDLEHNKEGMLMSSGLNIYSNDLKTLYVIFGDWIAYIAAMITLYLIMIGIIKKKR